MRRAQGMTRGACFPLRRRSAGPPPLLWPYPYHLFPRIVRPLCRFQRYSCPARPNPARRRHPARASAFPAQPYPCAPPASTAQSYPCLPPVFSCAPREGWILAGSQRVPCPPRHPAPARPRSPCGLTQRAAGSVRRVALRARPHPLRSPIPACRRLFPALRRPHSPCGLSLRPPASSAQPYPSVPRVLSVRRGKGGYWQGASACRARRVTLRAARRRVLSVRRGKGGYWQGYSARPSAYSARPNPARRPPASSAQPNPARRGFCPPPVFACAPREGRILEVSQRVPCPPRHPAPARVPCAAYPCLPPVFSCALPPASPARPNPARRGFCPPPVFACAPREGRILAASQRVPARRVALRPPARVPRAAYPCAPRVLPASSFACAPREGRILAASQRVPCPPRRPARVRIHCAVLSLPDAGFFLRSAARVPCAAYPCPPPVFACAPREGRILAGSQRMPCPPRPLRASASTVQPIPA